MDRNFIMKLVKDIAEYAENIDEMKIMEICGTHTQSIAKYGIASLLPANIKLLSGPGCPVCVTPAAYIDDAVDLMKRDDVILASFGDMARVKGTKTSLDRSGTKYNKLMIVYSPFEVLKIAEENKAKTVIFIAVGFETTAPAIASMIKEAKKGPINNIKILTSIKLMPPILEKILKQHAGALHGLICPGHVAAVMGEEYFHFLPQSYGVHSVIAGFGAADILAAIYLLVRDRCNNEKPRLRNVYKNCVSLKGNEKAKAVMNEVFCKDSGLWRGIGMVNDSALLLNEAYAGYDAAKSLDIRPWEDEASTACCCGDILMGKKEPKECGLFCSICNPSNPVGPCMVSSEGSCSIYYRYRR